MKHNPQAEISPTGYLQVRWMDDGGQEYGFTTSYYVEGEQVHWLAVEQVLKQMNHWYEMKGSDEWVN